jgi:hypothetical protein
VGLHVQKAPGGTVAVVGLAGNKGANKCRFAVIDVAGGANDNVAVVGRQHRALPDRRGADQPVVAGRPRLHVVDVGISLRGEQGKYVHRL